MHPSLSIVLPVFNEAGIAAEVATRVTSFAESHPDYEFLLVDDGSVDDTATILSEILTKKRMPNVSLFHYAPNRGKGHAILFGFQRSRGTFVCFTDGDLAYPLDYLDRIAAELKECDVVIGSRSPCRASQGAPNLRRRFLGIGYNRLVRFLLGLTHADTQAGLKGLRRESAERLFPLLHSTGFSFDVELLFLAKKLGCRIREIPVQPTNEHSYKTGKVKLLRDSAAMLADLCRIRARDWLGLYDEGRTRTP
ncbi:Undecaprenyl-phosphate 4-deoxy-4-formamido-L-arabinose transferase [Methylacidimicrobium tartarophylax]|uniref:Undecaprenyl-phosphate 4-deoxy-4-formamido-L-arabinose transferase n=1 Tax=Methylacidimicrobium tartarophylax TaxID=1041768 RepID=A0A5E6M635_9BACT|nr:Undecaprenyl-phosphate 4-deoxy-4-formamido-L-arabinose transferase [Methylacidimicrobium tartarophylax]